MRLRTRKVGVTEEDNSVDTVPEETSLRDLVIPVILLEILVIQATILGIPVIVQVFQLILSINR